MTHPWTTVQRERFVSALAGDVTADDAGLAARPTWCAETIRRTPSPSA